MVNRKKSGYNLTEVMLTLSIIGLIAIVMLALNNFGNFNYKANIRITQIDTAVQSWAKSVIKNNETGLGFTKDINSVDTLASSVMSKLATTSITNKGENQRELALENGGTLTLTWTPAEVTVDGVKKKQLGIILAQVPDSDLSEEYRILDDKIVSSENVEEEVVINDTPTPQTTSTPCTPCLVGTSSEKGCYSTGESCTSCIAGTYQDEEGQTSCKTCSVGTYQDGTGQTSCKTCPADTYQDGSTPTACKDCPEGQFSRAGAAKCSKCLAGTYYNTETKNCDKCPKGTYSPVDGATSCTPAKCLEYVPADGSLVATEVPAGYYPASGGKYTTSKATEVLACPDSNADKICSTVESECRKLVCNEEKMHCNADKHDIDNDYCTCTCKAEFDTDKTNCENDITATWSEDDCACTCDSDKKDWTGTQCECKDKSSCHGEAERDDNCECKCQTKNKSCGSGLYFDGSNNVCACVSCPADKPYWQNGECFPVSAAPTGHRDCMAGQDGYIGIYSAEQLAKIGNDANYPANGKYCQMATIDLSAYGVSYDNGQGWKPLPRFIGTYNGNNYEIQNLYINRTNTDFVGLFSTGASCHINNTHMTKVDVLGHSNVGGLAGKIDSKSTINNVSVMGDIKGIRYIVGGIVGSFSETTIEKSYVAGTVANTKDESYDAQMIGGIAGLSWSTGTIKNCYSTATVTGVYTRVGGLVGDNSGAIYNSYFAGTINVKNSLKRYIGILVGQNSGSIYNSYYDLDKIAEANNYKAYSGAYGRSTAAMQIPANYLAHNSDETDWDTTIWKLEQGKYPELGGGDPIACPSTDEAKEIFINEIAKDKLDADSHLCYFGSIANGCIVECPSFQVAQAGKLTCDWEQCTNENAIPTESGCQCKAGFEGENCTPCEIGTYKDTTGSQACTPCPGPKTTTESTGSDNVNACVCPTNTSCSGTYDTNTCTCSGCTGNKQSNGKTGAEAACTCKNIENITFSNDNEYYDTTAENCVSTCEGVKVRDNNDGSRCSCPSNTSTCSASGGEYDTNTCTCSGCTLPKISNDKTGAEAACVCSATKPEGTDIVDGFYWDKDSTNTTNLCQTPCPSTNEEITKWMSDNATLFADNSIYRYNKDAVGCYSECLNENEIPTADHLSCEPIVTCELPLVRDAKTNKCVCGLTADKCTGETSEFDSNSCKCIKPLNHDTCEDGSIPVSTAEQLTLVGSGSTLNGVTYANNAKYCQTNYINLAGYDAGDGKGWMPLPEFSGTYNGNNYTIANLYINRPDTDYVGLFSKTSSGEIKNVGLINNNITGTGAHIGGLVGDNSSSITNSYATGSVTGMNFVGGLVGYNTDGTISNSYATGSVTGNYLTGGLVGDMAGGSISNSYATGSVTGNYFTGGLVGDMAGGSISNSYATGSVTGKNDVGGLVGDISCITISNSYATGSVTGNKNVGGLVGYVFGSTIKNSYYDIETTQQNIACSTDCTGAVGKTTEEMYSTPTNDIYVDWNKGDNANVWCFSCGNYPKLKNMPAGSESATSCATSCVACAANTSCSASGGIYDTTSCTCSSCSPKISNDKTGAEAACVCSATKPDGTDIVDGFYWDKDSTNTTNLCQTPCPSTNEEITKWMSDNATLFADNSIYRYNKDAVGCYSECLNENEIPTADHLSCEPIVTCELPLVRDAKTNKCVCGLTADKCTGETSEFDSNSCKCIKPLNHDTCEDGSIPISTAEQLALVGSGSTLNGVTYANNAKYCQTNYINLAGYDAGDGKGWMPLPEFSGTYNGNNYTIANLYINRPDTASDYVGLFSKTSGGEIKNLGIINVDVTGSASTGGFVGCNYGSISNSYLTGSVSGTLNAVGGFVGLNFGSISNSHSTGSVTNTGESTGGFVGSNMGSISNSYSTSSVTSTGDIVGGFAGRTHEKTLAIINSYATGSVEGGNTVGGFVGHVIGSASRTIIDSYATGSVKATGGAVKECVGGFAGLIHDSTTIRNSYFDTTTSGQNNACGAGTCTGAVGKTTEEMHSTPTNDIYVEWNKGDNANVWCFSCSDYPHLKNMPAGAPDTTSCATSCVACAANTSCSASGGTYDTTSCTCSSCSPKISNDKTGAEAACVCPIGCGTNQTQNSDTCDCSCKAKADITFAANEYYDTTAENCVRTCDGPKVVNADKTSCDCPTNTSCSGTYDTNTCTCSGCTLPKISNDKTGAEAACVCPGTGTADATCYWNAAALTSTAITATCQSACPTDAEAIKTWISEHATAFTDIYTAYDATASGCVSTCANTEKAKADKTGCELIKTNAMCAAENNENENYIANPDGSNTCICGITASSCSGETSEFDEENCSCVAIGVTSTTLGTGCIPIATAEQLSWVGDNNEHTIDDKIYTFSPGASYCQTANIDLSGYDAGDGKGWMPLPEFSGTYNGNNHTIDNLYMNRPDDVANAYGGLFSTLTSADVRNVGLNNVNITASYAGGFAYNIEDTDVNNIYVKGKITAYRSSGLSSWVADGSDIYNSYTDVEITCRGSGGCAAFVSVIAGSSVNASYASGKITGGNDGMAGGFAYDIQSSTIQNSYSNVNIEDFNGTAAGFAYKIRFDSHLNNIYSTGKVSVTGGTTTKGLDNKEVYTPHVVYAFAKTIISAAIEHKGYAVSNTPHSTYNNVYFDKTANPELATYDNCGYYNGSIITDDGDTVCANIVGKTTEEMYSTPTNDIYVDWKNDDWCFSCSDYPHLKNMPAGAESATQCAIINSTGGCSLCPTGTYTKNDDINNCYACPLGTYSNIEGGTTCSLCDANNILITLTEESTSANACVCPTTGTSVVGYYWNTEITTSDDSEPVCQSKCPTDVSKIKTWIKEHSADFENIDNSVKIYAHYDSSAVGCISTECVIDGEIASSDHTKCEAPQTNENCQATYGENFVSADTVSNKCKCGITASSCSGETPVFDEDLCKCVSEGFHNTCEANTIKISTPEQLALVGSGKTLNGITYANDAVYCQTAPIDLNDYDAGDGQGWEPLPKFSGIYNGNNYTISNLYINRPATNKVGLFKNTAARSEIKNIGLVDVDVTGDNMVGGLVGIHTSKITNSYVIGSVTGNYDIGGLVGTTDSTAIITNSYAKGIIIGTSDVGGLVGSTSDVSSSSINNSYAECTVTGSEFIGGLVGFNSSEIINSYATGSVSGSEIIGCFVGLNEEVDTSKIENSYASCSITGNELLGWFAGSNYSTITNSYFETTSDKINGCGEGDCTGAVGKTTEEMKTAATFSAWSTSIWNIVDGYYPKLKWQN